MVQTGRFFGEGSQYAWGRFVLPQRHTPLAATPLLSRHVSEAFILASAAIGFFSILFWLVPTPWFTQNIPLVYHTHPSTALCLILSSLGISMFLQHHRLGMILCASSVLIIAGGTLLELLLKTPLGMNTFLIPRLTYVDMARPVGMSPNTATMLICAALVLVLEGVPLGRLERLRAPLAELLSFLVIAIPLAALAGYMTQHSSAYTWKSHVRMGWLTLTGGLCMGFGLVCAGWGITEQRSGRIPYWFPVLLCLVVLIFDLITPLGIAAGMAYVPLVFCSLWFRPFYMPFVFAALGSLLTIMGYYLSPPGPFVDTIVITNRVLTIGVLWFTSFLVYLSLRLEHRQRRSEQRLTALVNTSLNTVVMFQPDGRIENFNPVTLRMFGYEEADMRELYIQALVPGLYRSVLTSAGDKQLEDETPEKTDEVHGVFLVGKEAEGVRKDGSRFPVHFSVMSIQSEEQSMYCGIIIEMTRQKEVEAQLKKSSQDLARRNASLARSNQDLENFAYIASHDLQEPLRMVRSYCELLENKYKGKLDAEGEEFLAFAVDGAKRMQILIRDLLVYSRASRNELNFRPIRFEDLLKNVSLNLQKTMDETGAEFRVEGPLPFLVGEQVMVEQLVQNLVGNSLKFHKPDEPPLVQVVSQKQGDEWIISIKDNGIGFDMQYADKIFDMFKRLHGRDEFEGTGIGLAVCKRIVERHGGRIWAEGTPGKGATFSFTLPAHNPTHEDE